MNKKEFLKQLEQLLLDIPESERREAVEYYENYFEDAGPEMEQKIIEELGSPQEVAASIKKNLFGEEDFVKRENPGTPYQTQENKTTRNLLIAVIVILTFPVWIGIAGAAFGLLACSYRDRPCRRIFCGRHHTCRNRDRKFIYGISCGRFGLARSRYVFAGNRRIGNGGNRVVYRQSSSVDDPDNRSFV